MGNKKTIDKFLRVVKSGDPLEEMELPQSALDSIYTKTVYFQGSTVTLKSARTALLSMQPGKKKSNASAPILMEGLSAPNIKTKTLVTGRQSNVRKRPLFKFIDQEWLPQFLRDAINDFLIVVTRVCRYYDPTIPILNAALERMGENEILDCCSGAGGPWPENYEKMRRTRPNLKLKLCDYHPHEAAKWAWRIRFDGEVDYLSRSVDARRVPSSLGGFRTLFSSFHEFDPKAAQEILADAVAQGQGIGIFEFTQRSWRCILWMLLTPLAVFCLTPAIRPIRWWRFLLTYVIPLIPLLVTWDGLVSTIRCYTGEELREQIQSLHANYDWEVGEIEGRLSPVPILYLIGTPRQRVSRKNSASKPSNTDNDLAAMSGAKDAQGFAAGMTEERLEVVPALLRAYYRTVGWIQSTIVEKFILHRQVEHAYMILGGHIFFQTLSAAVELDLFSTLKKHPGSTLAELASALGCQEKPVRILLLGCTSLNLLKKSGDQYFNTALSSRLFCADTSANILNVVRWQHHINYKAMHHFGGAIKANTNVGLAEFEGDESTLYERLAHNPPLEKIFQDAMEGISVQANSVMSRTIDLSGVKHLVDVGGGNGTNVIALAKKFPHLRATVFDSPTVCEVAKANMAAAGLSERLNASPGNCFSDPFPKGADAIMFCHFLTIWSEDQNRALLTKCFDSLPIGGRVIIFNMMQDNNEEGPLSAAMGSPYFLTLATGDGMLYTRREYQTWLRQAGFQNVQEFSLPRDHSVIVGVKTA